MSIEKPQLSPESRDYRGKLAKELKEARAQDDKDGNFITKIKKVFKQDGRTKAKKILEGEKQTSEYKETNNEQRRLIKTLSDIKNWNQYIEKFGLPSKDQLIGIIKDSNSFTYEVREEAGRKLLEFNLSDYDLIFIFNQFESLREDIKRYKEEERKKEKERIELENIKSPGEEPRTSYEQDAKNFLYNYGPKFKELVDNGQIEFFSVNVGDQSKDDLREMLFKLNEEFPKLNTDTQNRKYENRLKWFEISEKKEEKKLIKVPIRELLNCLVGEKLNDEKSISYSKLIKLAQEAGLELCEPEIAIKFAAKSPELLGHDLEEEGNVVTIGTKVIEENKDFHHLFMVARNNEGRHLSIWDSIKNNDSIPIDGNDIVFVRKEKASTKNESKNKEENDNVDEIEKVENEQEKKEYLLNSVYMVLRENDNWDKYSSKIIERLKQFGVEVEFKSFPRNTSEEEIIQWFEENQEIFKNKTLFTDETCSPYNIFHWWDEFIENKKFDDRFSLDNLLQDVHIRISADIIKNHFNKEELFNKVNWISGSNFFEKFNKLTDSRKAEESGINIEDMRELYTSLFKAAISINEPKKVTFLTKKASHHIDIPGIKNDRSREGSIKADSEVTEFLKTALRNAGFPEEKISVVDNLPENPDLEKIEEMKKEWFFIDSHNRQANNYRNEGLTVSEGSEVLYLINPEVSDKEIEENINAQLDKEFKK